MKKETKYVRRMMAAREYELGEMESWLSDMASSGYHFDQVGVSRFWRFRTGEPKNMRYRVDLQMGEQQPDREFRYQDWGWEYAGSYGTKREFSIYRSPFDAEAVEIHTDPAEQAFLLMSLKKRMFRMAVSVCVLTAVIVALLLAVLLLGGTPVLNLVEGQTMQQLSLLTFYIYIIWDVTARTVGMKKLVVHLQEGRPVDHQAPWKRSWRREGIAFGVLMLYTTVVLVLCGIMLSQNLYPEVHPLPNLSGTLPIIQLTDFEDGIEMLSQEENQKEISDGGGNVAEKTWSPLTVEMWVARERGAVPEQQWSDGSGAYEPSVSTELYRLRFQGLAMPLAQDLTRRYNRDEYLKMQGYQIREPEDSRFDYLQTAVQEGNEAVKIIAVRGGTVMSVNYHGIEGLETLLVFVSEKLGE